MKFDYKEAIDRMETSSLLKKGLLYYIEVNKLKPKNMKELNKIFNEYKGTKL